MKVICINNEKNYISVGASLGYSIELLLPAGENINDILTVGKIYTIIEVQNGEYLLEHNKGSKRWFRQSQFITLDKLREEKLKQIGI